MKSITNYFKLFLLIQVVFILSTVLHECCHLLVSNYFGIQSEFKFCCVNNEMQSCYSRLDSIYQKNSNDIVNGIPTESVKEYRELKESIYLFHLLSPLSGILFTFMIGVAASVLYYRRRYKYGTVELQTKDHLLLALSLNLSRNAFFLFLLLFSFVSATGIGLKSLDEYALSRLLGIDYLIPVIILGLTSTILLFFNFFILLPKGDKFRTILIYLTGQVFGYFFWIRFIFAYLSKL